MKQKIKTREELKEIVESFKKKGKKIVTTNGSFDILHLGHVKSFQEAKKYGDILILGLNSDSSIKQYKSPDRPINPQQDRAEMLAALECVDYVTIFDETDPRALLEVIKPNVHVKSKSGFTGIEKETVEKNGGEIVLIEDTIGKSTTNLIDKILKAQTKKPVS